MSKQVIYVGIDVGSQELVAALEGRRPRSFKHSQTGIREMVAWAGRIASGAIMQFCLEATGVYGYSVACRLFREHGCPVSVINPAQIAAYARAQLRRTKTDFVDAQVILSFAASQKPPLWKPESNVLRQLYLLVTEADRIRQEQTQWSNREHTRKYQDDLPQVIKQSRKAVQRTLKRQLEKIEKATTNICKQNDDIKQQVELLCSIPGIADHSAVRILAYAKSALWNLDRRALTAHAGLAPAHKQSGTSINGKSRIAKQGDRRLRTALFMPAVVAAHHNPILKIFYQRLLEKGKPKMLAIVAVMKKLLMMIRAMLKNNLPFNPNYALDS
ncbi:MAG: hypothetical protein CVV37_08420 [Nitrospira bacterium HGW-Nitrospira-1]|nr:MAG: hypothetical protein CVV37_08420 [Nitrospira bacterium HGW-Nitrospira-1]